MAYLSPPVIAVSGLKNTGKTTLLTALIPLFREKGYKVAVIKHDGHDFEPDVTGTDSYTFRAIGAEGVAIFSPYQFMVIEKRADATLEMMIEHFTHMDLIFLEGGKHYPYPKIEILRAAVSSVPVCPPSTVLAYYTDLTEQLHHNIPQIPFGDVGRVFECVCDFLNKKGSRL